MARSGKYYSLAVLLLVVSMVLVACGGNAGSPTAASSAAPSMAASTAPSTAPMASPTTPSASTAPTTTSMPTAAATTTTGAGPTAAATGTGAGAGPTAGATGAAGGCAPAGDTSKGTALIYSSMPMTGASRGQTVSVVNGAKLAVEEFQGAAGGYKINFQALDDATAAAGHWTAEAESANANKAVNDKATAYIGTFNSGAAAVAIPILNAAGIPMVSPANTAINLTVSGPPDPGLFNSLYKSGPRNYFRVVPNDRIQGAAGANWAKELGATKVYILHDNEVYGKGLAQVFQDKAKANGLQVVAFEGVDTKAGSFGTLMQKVVNSGADLVYWGGLTDDGGPQLLKDLRSVQPDPQAVKFMGPDGILESAFIEGAGADTAEGTYGTVAAAPPANLTGPGKAFFDKYQQTYGEAPEPYAIFGHDAMLSVLLAMNKVCSNDPAKVLDALNNLGTVDGALGKWQFDKNGDTTLSAYHGWQVKNGKWEWVKELSAK